MPGSRDMRLSRKLVVGVAQSPCPDVRAGPLPLRYYDCGILEGRRQGVTPHEIGHLVEHSPGPVVDVEVDERDLGVDVCLDPSQAAALSAVFPMILECHYEAAFQGRDAIFPAGRRHPLRNRVSRRGLRTSEHRCQPSYSASPRPRFTHRPPFAGWQRYPVGTL